MTVISQIETLADAMELSEYLDKAATASLAGIEHQAIQPGAALRFFEESLACDETGLWVAREEGALQGICMTGAWVAPISGERMAAVLALYVNADARHQGVSRALVQAALAELRQRGITHLGARVEHNDDARISMGERWGWTRGWEWLDSGPNS